MVLNLNLTPELEAKLREQAAAIGEPLEAFVLQAVQEKLLIDEDSSDQNESPSHEHWMTELRAWASSHSPVIYFVDDSRDGIYGNRGE